MKTVLIIVTLSGVFVCSHGIIELDAKGKQCPDIEEEEWNPFDDSQISQIPDSINWAARNAVSPVGNAERNPYSWAFAVAGVVESRHFIAHKNLTILSKQNLIDCCRKRCGGGRLVNAFQCVKTMGGIEAEETYPDSGQIASCQFNQTNISAKVIRNFVAGKRSEKVLAWYVSRGPVAIEISYGAILKYKEGILKEANCEKSSGVYSVLIVGYGSCEKEGDYWILQTSMGSNWGEGGYMRIARNKELCGMGNRAYYPQVL